MVVVVLGAGGPTGRECVKALLDDGKEVRAVVRDPTKYEGSFPTDRGLSVVSGDVTNAASLETAFQGANGVIFAASGKTFWSASDVDEKGVGTAAMAAKNAAVKRVVLVSSALVTPKNRFHPIRIILNNIRWGLMDAKYAGENLLRSSGVPYTVVRPGGLTNDPPFQSQLKLEQGDKTAGRVSRADVAAVCAAALSSLEAENTTFELSSAKQGPATTKGNLPSLFQHLKRDPL